MLQTSPNGINWTVVSAVNELIGSNQLFCIIANNSIIILGSGTTPYYVYSEDNINWITGTYTWQDARPTSYIWNGTYYIATGYAVYWSGTYSSNGKDWNHVNSPMYPFPSNTISWGLGSASLYNYVTSHYQKIYVDLKNWINGQTFSVIGGTSSTKFLSYSDNGITWTDSSTGNTIFSGGTVFGIGYNLSQWLAGGTSTSNRIAYSSDGKSWTASSSGNSIFTSKCNCFAWNGTKWIAGGSGTNQLASSTNGITWTGLGNAFFSSECNAILYNGTRWVAGGSSGSGAIIIYSSNGTSWSTALAAGNSVLSSKCSCLAWNGTLWVAGGESKQLAWSNDGITWVNATTGSLIFGTRCRCVAYGNGYWVAGGGTSVSIAYSTDGKNWTASTSGSAIISDCYSVAWNNSYWIATGGGKIAISYNGIEWLERSTIFTTPHVLLSRYISSFSSITNPFTANISTLYLIGHTTNSYSDPVNLTSSSTNSIINNYEQYQIPFTYVFDIKRDYYLKISDTSDGSGVFNYQLTNYIPKLVITGSITPVSGSKNTNNVFTVTLTNNEYYDLKVYTATWYIFRADNNTGSNTTYVTSSSITIDQKVSFTYNPGSSGTTQYFYICSTNVFATSLSVLINTGVTFI